jgi:broad specificity phosphatase PhoE
MRVPIRPPEIPDDPATPSLPPPPSLGAPVRVWLFRHADVADAWQGRAYGNLDVPLSARGVEETSALVEAFARTPFARVASSPLSRALLLGRGLSETTGAPLAIDDRLREVWRGEWQGLPVDEFRARWEADRAAFAADPWNWKGHGGESDADIWARAWPALRETAMLARETAGHASPTIGLATHYNVIRVLVTRLSGIRSSRSFGFKNQTARASLLVDDAVGWTLVCANVEAPAS